MDHDVAHIFVYDVYKGFQIQSPILTILVIVCSIIVHD